MWIKKVTLAWLGPFGARPMSKSEGYAFDDGRHTFEFKRGSVAILGENGVGKSSLIDFAYSIITNDFGRFDGTRIDCINNQAPEGVKAGGEVVFEHDTVTYHVGRFVGEKSSYFLRREGVKEITSARDGDQALVAAGVNKKILDFCVFKRQPGSENNALDDFLRTTPGERAEVYMTLNETQHCGVIHDVLGDILNHDKELNTEVVDNSDTLATTLTNLRDAKMELKTQLKAHVDLLLVAEHRKKAEGIVRDADSLIGLKADLAKQRDLRNQSNADCEGSKDRLDTRRNKLARYQERKNELTPIVDKAKVALAGIKAYEKNVKQRTKLKDQLKQLEEERRTKKVPIMAVKLREDVTAATAKADRRELATCEDQYDRAWAIVNAFAKKGVVECPTCGTPVDNLGDHLEEQRDLTVSLKTKIATLKENIAAWERKEQAQKDYDDARQKYDVFLAGNASSVKECKEALAHLANLEEPEGDRAALEKSIAEFDQLSDDIATFVGKVQASEKELAVNRRYRDSVDERIKEIQGKIEANTHEPELVEKARTRLAEHRLAEIEIAKIEAKLEGNEQAVEATKKELEELRVRLKRSKKLRRVVRILTRVRDLFHRQSLPQEVAQSNLRLMEEDINKELERYGGRFWVEVAAGLTFTVHKPGEPPHRAERLSGGQKGVLAMAFWPALGLMYKVTTGLMVLDEPTANLDAANIGYLRDAIARQTNQIRGDRQVLLVTHAESLRSACDQTIVIERL